MSELQELQEAIGRMAREKGFWLAHQELGPFHRAAYVKLALIHSEVSEAVEALRDTASGDTGVAYYGEEGKPEGLAFELADVVIRALDMCEWLGFSMENLIRTKMEYNAKRAAMHGRSA